MEISVNCHASVKKGVLAQGCKNLPVQINELKIEPPSSVKLNKNRKKEKQNVIKLNINILIGWIFSSFKVTPIC